jgi:hypothetical protein
LSPKLPVSLDSAFLIVSIGLMLSNIVMIIIVHKMVLFSGITGGKSPRNAKFVLNKFAILRCESYCRTD